MLTNKKKTKDVCEAIFFATLYDNCTLVLDATWADLGFYVAAIQMEDYSNSLNAGPLSSVYYFFVCQN